MKKHSRNPIFYILAIFIAFFVFVFLFAFLPETQEISINTKNIYMIESQKDPEKALLVQQTKYDTISKSVLTDFNETKIKDGSINYVIELMAQDKLINRENSIIQEVIVNYIENNTDVATDLTYYFMLNRLNEFGTDSDRRLTNQLLVLYLDEKEVILYNQTNTLRPLNEAKVSSQAEIYVSLFEKQKYIFTLFDGGTEEVTVDLFTGETNGDLNKYLDVNNNNRPRVGTIGVDSEFTLSENSYLVKTYIWE